MSDVPLCQTEGYRAPSNKLIQKKSNFIGGLPGTAQFWSILNQYAKRRFLGTHLTAWNSFLSNKECIKKQYVVWASALLFQSGYELISIKVPGVQGEPVGYLGWSSCLKDSSSLCFANDSREVQGCHGVTWWLKFERPAPWKFCYVHCLWMKGQ